MALPKELSVYFLLLEILEKPFKLRLLKILFLVIIGAGFEVLSIGFIFPAIAMLADPANTGSGLWVRIISHFGVITSSQIVAVSIACMVLLFIFKATYLAFLAFAQSRFVYAVKADVAQRLFAAYIRRSYEFHLQTNSSVLVNNVIIESSQFVIRALIPGIVVTTEIFMMTAIIGLLLYVEPLGALVLFTTTALVIRGLQLAAKDKLTTWGNLRNQLDSTKLRYVQEALGAIKEIKLMGLENIFLSQFMGANISSTRIEGNELVIQQLPRYLLETIAIFGLSVLILCLLVSYQQPAAIIPVLALFSAASFRIMSSAYRVISSLYAIKFSNPVIKLIYADLNTAPMENSDPDENFDFYSNISLKNISFKYETSDKEIISSANLCINKGDCVGIIGPSGSGKSTLIDIISGLLVPTNGVVLVDGEDIQAKLKRWQKKIGYVPQTIFLMDDTIKNNISFGNSDPNDSIKIREALKASRLDEFVQSLPEGWDTIVGERGARLSGGQRQRIGIARALYRNAQLIILDEATSALDTATEKEVMGSIAALKGSATMIIIAHRISTLKDCNKIYQISDGLLEPINICQS